MDWQYRQEQTESKLLGHSHTMHKPHKMTGGGHERAQAQASVWVQPLAKAVIPNAHMPQMHQPFILKTGKIVNSKRRR